MKKLISTLLIAVVLIVSVIAPVYAIEMSTDDITMVGQTYTITFDVESTGWRNYNSIYFHIYDYEECESIYYWGSKSEKGYSNGDGTWSYSVNLSDNKLYTIIFHDDWGRQTYELFFNTSCLSSVAYCDGTSYENPQDSTRTALAAYWEGINPSRFGPVKNITSIGNVVGECLPNGETDQGLFEYFLNSVLTNAQIYTGKSEQALVDDVAFCLGLSASEVEESIENTGVDVQWSKNDSQIDNIADATSKNLTLDSYKHIAMKEGKFAEYTFTADESIDYRLYAVCGNAAGVTCTVYDSNYNELYDDIMETDISLEADKKYIFEFYTVSDADFTFRIVKILPPPPIEIDDMPVISGSGKKLYFTLCTSAAKFFVEILDKNTGETIAEGLESYKTTDNVWCLDLAQHEVSLNEGTVYKIYYSAYDEDDRPYEGYPGELLFNTTYYGYTCMGSSYNSTIGDYAYNWKYVNYSGTEPPTEAPTAAPTAAPTQEPTAAPTVAPTQAPTQPSVKVGDVDEDGIINIFDATEIQLYLAKYQDLSDTQMIAADADRDTVVNIFDVTRIQLYLAKYITEL